MIKDTEFLKELRDAIKGKHTNKKKKDKKSEPIKFDFTKR